ncbi:MAG: hypothetical protein GXO70_07205 [Acidobacteria bacterium]|nr:hypothetical protein [Acidobacteriota bacterium]
MRVTKGTRKRANLMALLAVVVITMAMSLQGAALCVGADGSVAMFASGSECQCAMHEHGGTVCSHTHGETTVRGFGCSCTDINFRLSPAVIDSGSRTKVQIASQTPHGFSTAGRTWVQRKIFPVAGRGSPGLTSGENPILLRLQATVLII